MALRNLAAKMRIPAAARLRSAPIVPPASRSRVVSFSSCSDNSSRHARQVQRDREWYVFHCERYETVTRDLATYRLQTLWAERVIKLLTWTYRLGLPFVVAATGLKATGYRPQPVETITCSTYLCRCMCSRCKNSVCGDGDFACKCR